MIFITNLRKSVSVFYLVACVLLVSCGTGDEQLAGGGIGGTGITLGTVTGFGSVFVNGIEFDTTGASRNIDDVVTISTGFDDDTVMGAGMVVTIAGTINPDGMTGGATSITYDEAVNGPITAVPMEDPDGVHKSFNVFDISVTVDRNSTVFVNTDYRSLQPNDVVEISGFYNNAGTLLATRLEKEGKLEQGTVVEIRGTVNGFDGVDTFSIGALKITFDGDTVFDNLPGTVADGQFVEVNGLLQGGTSLLATRVERESDTVSNHTGAINIEGLVSSFVDIGNFLVDGVPVDASNAALIPEALAGTLANNQRIEIEGTVFGGMIVADRIEQRGGVVKLAGQVTVKDVSAGIFSLEIVTGQPAIAVQVDSQTQLEDELQQVQPFTLLQINTGDSVLVQGYIDNTGNVIAAAIKRRILEEHELTGPVSAASGDAISGSVIILGITMLTDSGTEFEDGDDQPFPDGGDHFYSQVNPGDIVELEDRMPADGIADEVELRN